MSIKKVIENSELHYTASKLIDEESFEQMVKELSESIESNLDSQVMSYLRYYIEKRKEINEIKEISFIEYISQSTHSEKEVSKK